MFGYQKVWVYCDASTCEIKAAVSTLFHNHIKALCECLIITVYLRSAASMAVKAVDCNCVWHILNWGKTGLFCFIFHYKKNLGWFIWEKNRYCEFSKWCGIKHTVYFISCVVDLSEQISHLLSDFSALSCYKCQLCGPQFKKVSTTVNCS